MHHVYDYNHNKKIFYKFKSLITRFLFVIEFLPIKLEKNKQFKKKLNKY